MKTKHRSPHFLVKYTVEGKTQSKFWDGVSLLSLGFPTRFILQPKKNDVFVRDFASPGTKKSGLTKFSLAASALGKTHQLSEWVTDQIAVHPLTAIAPVNISRASQFKPINFGPVAKIVSAEDQLFNRYLRHLVAACAVLSLLFFIGKSEEPAAVPEEIIPKKYAKIIMTKPKEKTLPSAAAAARSQAQVKAVARAMQSKTVQKSISSILKGGITKYSIMSTGKSIQTLAQKVQGTNNISGTVLQGKASDLLAASHIGSQQVGSENGYAAGRGVSVSGQGTGQLHIGLDTKDAQVDEGLTKEEVARVIHAHMSEIRFCYESAIIKDPTLAGKVLVDFKINPDGVVASSKIAEATVSDKNVGQCLSGKLKRWQFPKPRGGVHVAVSYPFIFKSLSR